ncbi:hypothetical protein MRX96_042894 [Rhipicephalus microplus]
MSGSPNPAAVLLVSAACYAGRILVDWLALWAYPWCDHPTKCFDYVQELDASLDRSVDPCDNFYEHVCAHWSRQVRRLHQQPPSPPRPNNELLPPRARAACSSASIKGSEAGRLRVPGLSESL